MLCSRRTVVFSSLFVECWCTLRDFGDSVWDDVFEMRLLPLRFECALLSRFLECFQQILSLQPTAQPFSKQQPRISSANRRNGLNSSISRSSTWDISSTRTNPYRSNLLFIHLLSSSEVCYSGLDVFDALIWVFEIAGLPAARALIRGVECEGYEAVFGEELGVQACKSRFGSQSILLYMQ